MRSKMVAHSDEMLPYLCTTTLYSIVVTTFHTPKFSTILKFIDKHTKIASISMYGILQLFNKILPFVLIT